MKQSTFLKGLLSITKANVLHSYKMGKDCAVNGANEKNCHFSLFQNRECTDAWEQGKKDMATQWG